MLSTCTWPPGKAPPQACALGSGSPPSASPRRPPLRPRTMPESGPPPHPQDLPNHPCTPGHQILKAQPTCPLRQEAPRTSLEPTVSPSRWSTPPGSTPQGHPPYASSRGEQGLDPWQMLRDGSVETEAEETGPERLLRCPGWRPERKPTVTERPRSTPTCLWPPKL